MNLRYAYGEHFAPVFNSYQSLGTTYPIAYAKIIVGRVDGSDNTNYTGNYGKAIVALAWQKHINSWGTDHLLLQAGKAWSDNTLPLSKLFAANGLRYDAFSYYSFGGFMNSYPYSYYSDEFCAINYTHDLDWKLYNIVLSPHKYSSAPALAIACNVLSGNMQNRAMQLSDFMVPYKTFIESGLLLNNLLRLNYRLYYICLNMGYFYKWDDAAFNPNINGRFVIGAGIEL
jgi:hypothetical protein